MQWNVLDQDRLRQRVPVKLEMERLNNEDCKRYKKRTELCRAEGMQTVQSYLENIVLEEKLAINKKQGQKGIGY